MVGETYWLTGTGRRLMSSCNMRKYRDNVNTQERARIVASPVLLFLWSVSIRRPAGVFIEFWCFITSYEMKLLFSSSSYQSYLVPAYFPFTSSTMFPILVPSEVLTCHILSIYCVFFFILTFMNFFIFAAFEKGKRITLCNSR